MTETQAIPKTRAEMVELLADIEHQRWSDWTLYQFSRGVPVSGLMNYEIDPEALIIPGEWVERWARQARTPYQELSEREKEADREQVGRYWGLFAAFVAEWLITWGEGDFTTRELREEWLSFVAVGLVPTWVEGTGEPAEPELPPWPSGPSSSDTWEMVDWTEPEVARMEDDGGCIS